MKKLNLNAANICILKNDKDFFGTFDKINLNTAKATFTKETYNELLSQGMNLNAAQINIIEFEGEAVDIGDAIIDGSVDYRGKYLIGGRIQIVDEYVLDGVTGILANDIIAPEGIKFDFKVDGRVHFYPGNAVIVDENIKLNERYVARLEDNVVLWTFNQVDALDDKAVAVLIGKGITVRCGHLLISESSERLYGKEFKADRIDVIPDGFEYLDGDITLTTLNAGLYGDKIYVNGNFIIADDVTKELENFSEIIVTGEVYVSSVMLSQWKKVGKAGKIIPCKGKVWLINGTEKITHGQLDAAKTAGLQYTLIINGVVEFTEDVTKDDLDCIAAVSYNGVIKMPDQIIPFFKSKVIEANGLLESLKKEEVKEAEDVNKYNINVADFVRI